MKELDKFFKNVEDWLQDVFSKNGDIKSETKDLDMSRKIITIDLPAKPSSGAFSSGPSGDTEYDEALNAWRKEVNARILESIPPGYSLQSSQVKHEKIVRDYAEIVVEKND